LVKNTLGGGVGGKRKEKKETHHGSGKQMGVPLSKVGATKEDSTKGRWKSTPGKQSERDLSVGRVTLAGGGRYRNMVP